MPLHKQIAIGIREEAEVGSARRRAQLVAANAGLTESEASKAAIIASESATNVIKHGKGGEVLLRELDHGVEVIAVDKGPGMSDVSRCLSDGFSTSGTAGTGLGAIKRLSSTFDIYSQSKIGTAMVSRLLNNNGAGAENGLNFGVICRPKHGETVCGDSWFIRTIGQDSWILVVDGLGHGPDANEAALEAVRVFRDLETFRSTIDCIEALHLALRKTRGAAVAVVRIDREAKQVRCSGVGNIAVALVGGGTSRSLVSHNGILGHELRRVQEFSYAYTPGSKLIMSSDGLATWNLDKYPGLMMRHPSTVAAVLYRDFWRQRDDVTVLVAQEAA